jgi:hypothetical protein
MAKTADLSREPNPGKQTGGHDTYLLGGRRMPIPRHNEIPREHGTFDPQRRAGCHRRKGPSAMSVTYTATAERDGHSWHVRVPAISRSTSARWASEVQEMAKDLISAMTDLDMSAIDVEVKWKLPADALDHWTRSSALRNTAAEANAESAREARLAARALHDAGLGSTEVGTVLGVSRQRAHQLISG